jgi:hypothetical protein
LLLVVAGVVDAGPSPTPPLPVYYVVADADSVMLQCDGQVNRNTAGDHSSTTGQAFSYGCGPSAPSSNFMMSDHDVSMIKCNGGNPAGNGAWLPVAIGQQVVVYCVSGSTPTPTVTPTPTPTPTPSPSGQPTPPPLTNPQNPISYGADPSGSSDSSGAFSNAANAGDIDVPAGNFLINGDVDLGARNMRCESGAILKQTVLARGTMFQINGTGSVFNCDFRGQYYNVNGTGWANHHGAGYWANELTCGQSASGAPFNYSGNTCQDNIVDAAVSSRIAITPVAGGGAATYIGNTCALAIRLSTRISCTLTRRRMDTASSAIASMAPAATLARSTFTPPTRSNHRRPTVSSDGIRFHTVITTRCNSFQPRTLGLRTILIRIVQATSKLMIPVKPIPAT